MSDKIIHPVLIQNPHIQDIQNYLADLADSEASCGRSKCAAVIIVNQIEIIGEGWNSRPCDAPFGKCTKDDVSDKFKSDRTCCVHAEQRAIMDAMARNAHLIKGSHLYFLRVDGFGIPTHSGEPYCTICSKLALDAGISKFCLYLRQGWTAYDTNYYNQLSFNFGKPRK